MLEDIDIVAVLPGKEIDAKQFRLGEQPYRNEHKMGTVEDY